MSVGNTTLNGKTDFKSTFMSDHVSSDRFPYVNVASNDEDDFRTADMRINRIRRHVAATYEEYFHIFEEACSSHERLCIPVLVHQVLKGGADVLFFGSLISTPRETVSEFLSKEEAPSLLCQSAPHLRRVGG